jgi:predicted SnoaL-like aldol condensation-catalyzing enzyme
MGEEVQLVQQLMKAVFADGDPAAVDGLVHGDFISYDPAWGSSADRNGLRQVVEVIAAFFDARALEVDEYIPTTDGRVVHRWSMLGTWRGTGTLADGTPARMRGIDIWQCANGLIVEHWGISERGNRPIAWASRASSQ